MNFGNLRGIGFPVEFASPLGGAAWAVLAGIPVGIIALYFLKLRRRPLQVPSTLLWRRSLEDLHVNSLFQRLRKNLLLFLQLMAVLLAMLALTGPRIRGTTGQGRRFVLAIDNSASMSATDVAPNRLARAKEEAKKIVSSMEGDDLAMVISFSDRARIVSNYTSNGRLLLQRIDAIAPTEATTSLREALQVAAGLANPSRQYGEPGEGVVATSVVTPKLLIYTDGGFADVEGFSLGNLEPEIVVIGPPVPPLAEADPQSRPGVRPKTPSDNVAILALQTRRSDEQADSHQVFGRVHNYRGQAVATEAQLLRHDPGRPGAPGTLVDAIALNIPAQSDQSFKFDLPDAGAAELEVRLTERDAQALDDRTFTLVGNPRKAQVLVVTSGNAYLIDTLKTPTTVERADVTIATLDQSQIDPIGRDVQAGRFDLIIYDRVRPEGNPEANTLYFGALPPGKAFASSKTVEAPVILDWDVAHPLMQYIRDLSTVVILKAIAVEPPVGSTTLLESNQGPLAFVVPREGYSDAVVAFALMDGEKFNTNWFQKYSFPLFLFNALQVLGNSRESTGDEVHAPGQPVVLRVDSDAGQVEVTSADGRNVERLTRTSQGTFVASNTGTTGLYHALWGADGGLAFAVNQFDLRESDLAPRGLVPEGVPPAQADAYKIKIGYNPVVGTPSLKPSRKDWWKPLAALALGVILVEWYIYNRRVYI